MRSKKRLLLLLAILLGASGCAGTSSTTQSSAAAPSGLALSRQIAGQAAAADKQNRLQAEVMKQSGVGAARAAADYRVGPEDLLEVNFLDTDKLHSEVRVNGQGAVGMLLIGAVEVAGLTPTEIAAKLTRLYKEKNFLKNPQITVSVKEYRYQRVAVTGAVNKPDSYALIGPRTLMEVLGMAGGLSDKSGESAHIIRARSDASSSAAVPQQSFSPGTDTIVVDLNRLLLRGATELNLSIQNGDVVFIPFAQTAYVLGSVGKPGGVALRDNMTVTKAIAESGGLHTMLSSPNATILRMDENGRQVTLPVNIERITKGQEADIALKENDIVYVQESSVKRFFFDFKMLMPGSFGMSVPGML